VQTQHGKPTASAAGLTHAPTMIQMEMAMMRLVRTVSSGPGCTVFTLSSSPTYSVKLRCTRHTRLRLLCDTSMNGRSPTDTHTIAAQMRLPSATCKNTRHTHTAVRESACVCVCVCVCAT